MIAEELQGLSVALQESLRRQLECFMGIELVQQKALQVPPEGLRERLTLQGKDSEQYLEYLQLRSCIYLYMIIALMSIIISAILTV
jgi:hypothetical protein